MAVSEGCPVCGGDCRPAPQPATPPKIPTRPWVGRVFFEGDEVEVSPPPTPPARVGGRRTKRVETSHHPGPAEDRAYHGPEGDRET